MSGISLISDTNPLIYLLDGNEEVASFLNGKYVWVSVISELELYGKKGMTRSEILMINNLIESCFVAELNPYIKTKTKELLQEYHVRLPDAIIAATALYMGLPLFTSDVGFQKINGLQIIKLEI